MKKILLSCVVLSISIGALGEEKNWNFGNEYVTVDGNSYYLDPANKVAQFYTRYSTCDSLMVVPATISYGDVTYTVRSMKGASYIPGDISKKVQVVSLPNTLQRLDYHALDGFTNLRLVKVSTTTPPELISEFKGNASSYVKVLLPKGTIHAYRIADSRWNDFLLIDGEGNEVSVKLSAAGTLSSEIVKKADYLQDVNILKVEGSMNTEDMNVIKKSMPNLVSIDLSDAQLTNIPDEWINGKWGVESITLPKVLTNIGSSAFNSCYHLATINFPSPLKSIGSSAFRECRSLKEAELNEGLSELGTSVFYNCSNLKKVYLPSTLKTLSSYTFKYTSSLEDIKIAEGLLLIDQYAFEESGLKSITMPSTLKTINHYAFQKSSLEKVVLNEGLEYIKTFSFAYCNSLKEITLPSTLIYLYDLPFYDNKSLKNIYVRAGVPPYLNGTCPLSNVELNDVVLHVPAMSQAAYKSTPGWSNFYTIESVNNYRPLVFAASDEYSIDMDYDLSMLPYKPTLQLLYSYWQRGNNTSLSYGAVTANGSGAISLSKYTGYYDYNEWYNHNDNGVYMTSLVNNLTLTADTLTTTLWTQDRTWAFVSFPYDIKVKDIKAIGDGDTQFAIREYSGENRAMGDMNYTWVNLDSESTLQANKGYIINTQRQVNGSNQYNSGLSMTSSKATKIAKDNVSIALNAYPSEFTQNQGWNLIGNPYPCYFDTRYMDFSSPITVWNMRNKTYSAYSPQDDAYILSPGEAFFVQCSGNNQSISFSKEGRQTNKVVRTVNQSRAMAANPIERKIINLVLSDGKQTDRTRIVLNEKASYAYELDKDAAKFISNEAAQVYTIDHGVQYAINERPEGNGVISLGAHFCADGEYTLSLSDDDNSLFNGTDVTLVDTQDGKCQLLNEKKAYTFTAQKGICNRFVIKIGKSGTTGITELDKDYIKSTDTEWYNLSGQRVDAKSKGLLISRSGKKILVK